MSAQAVQVRLFAALRDAAATGHLAVEASRLPELLEELRRRYGEPFTSRLSVSSVLVDGEPVALDADVPLAAGAEVVLLPPFSGGS